MWYSDLTDQAGTTGGNVTLEFDLNELNPTIPSASNQYRIITRATNNSGDAWTVLSTVPTNVAGVLSFSNLNVADLDDRYVTIATLDNVASPLAPLVTLSVDPANIAENGGVATFTATLSGSINQTVTVELGITGTAAGSLDFSASAPRINIASGATSGTITVTGLDDLITEIGETVIVDILTVTSGTEDGVQTEMTTIIDDELTPDVTLSIGSTTLAETGGSTTVTATLSSLSGVPVTVDLVAGGTAIHGTDYSLPLQIVIPAGSASASVDLDALSDALDELNETITLDIDTVTNANEDGVQQVAATITDDDLAPNVSLSADVNAIVETGGLSNITVELDAPSGLPVTVTLAYAGSADISGATIDYTTSATTLIIPAGSTSAVVNLVPSGDLLDEDNETIIVDITTVTNGTEDGVQQETVTIIDDDAQPLVTLSLDNATINENSGVATFTATLGAVSGRDVTVNLGFTGSATATGTDYTVSGASITIAEGDTTGTITVTADDDTLDEANETVIVDITTITNGTEDNVQQETTTILDDEAPVTVTLSIDNDPIVENGGVATVTATLSAASALPVDITLATGGAAITSDDYSISTLLVSIPAGSTTESAIITGVDDALDEDDEDVTVDIVAVVNGTENGVQSVSTTITDDDALPLVTLLATSAVIAENGGVSTVRATLDAVSGRDVTVNLAYSGAAVGSGTDYTAAATQIIIPAGLTSVERLVTADNDTLDEANEDIIVDITTVINGTEDGVQQESITIIDDDAAPLVSACLLYTSPSPRD